MEFGILNMLFAVGLTFLLTVGLMYSVSNEDNPTPTQIRNRIICRRRWRKIKKAFSLQDEAIAFMFGVVVLLAGVVLFFSKLHGVI